MPEQQLLARVGVLLLSLPVVQISGCTILAQSEPESPPVESQEIVQPQAVMALPGQLDTVPVFNSNSPEWVKTEGILLSTFPPSGKFKAAHLNFPFQGRFDLFLHHYTYARRDGRSLYLGNLFHNPGRQPVTVEVLQAASYLLQEAPPVPLPHYAENPNGTVYSGPGDRAVDDVLRGKRNADFPQQLVIPPGQSQLLMNHPIPVRLPNQPVNGRSTLIRVRSSSKVYAASLAIFAGRNSNGSERPPTLTEWQALLNTGRLAGPRDLTPTPPKQTSGKLIYGRVAGVSQGSHWQARLVGHVGAADFTIPQRGQAISYALDTLMGNRLGTGSVQTAPLLVRYPDTAYAAHGNYGVEYNLSLPLYNATNQPQTVALTLLMPVAEDRLTRGGLRFFQPSLASQFFRGTVRLRYIDGGQHQTRYVHLSYRMGQLLPPLLRLTMPPRSRKSVQLDFIYPPDSTPPQVLTVRTTNSARLNNSLSAKNY